MPASEQTLITPLPYPAPKPRQDWQRELAHAISDPDELLQVLQLHRSDLPFSLDAAQGFSLRVPRSFVECMQKGDPLDPLLLQVLPLQEEQRAIEGFSMDPVGDSHAEATPGLLHKYHGRALLLLTGACGIHCRYCFRRHYPYAQANPLADHWQQALDYLSAHGEIEEIILSGGDPLSLRDDRLSQLVGQLETIPHLKRLRIHTRMPVVLPARIGVELLDWVHRTRLQVVLVTHCNHPNEISEALVTGLSQLRSKGNITLLNQSVLLHRINDHADTLALLSNRLFEAGVMPYYLHLLDRVHGAHHFEVPRERALAIMDELNSILPGYLVPRLVQEIAGEPGKMPVTRY